MPSDRRATQRRRVIGLSARASRTSASAVTVSPIGTGGGIVPLLVEEHRARAGQDLGDEGVEQGGRQAAVDDQPAGPRRAGERRVEVERVAVAADPGEGLDVVRGDRPRPTSPACPTAGGCQSTRRSRPAGQIRSNRSTGRTKTVAPPTSTSSG